MVSERLKALKGQEFKVARGEVTMFEVTSFDNERAESNTMNDQSQLTKSYGGGVARPNARSKTASGRLNEAGQAFF